MFSPSNTRLDADTVGYIFDHAESRLVIADAALTPLGAEMVGALGVEAQVAFGELTLVAPRERIVEVLTTLCIVASYLGWVSAQIKALGLTTVTMLLHPEVESKVTINVARSPEEAEMQASGVDVMASMFERDEAGFTEDYDPNAEPGATAEVQSDDRAETEQAQG